MQKVVIAILFCFTSSIFSVFGQNPEGTDNPPVYTDLVERAYGLDQDLVNGLQYYNRYLLAQNHPYFIENGFHMGSVTVRGRIYNNISLKYDIHSQHVEIEYESFSGGLNQLISVTDRLQAFVYGPYHFEKLKLEGNIPKYYQVIETGCFTCYIYWEKGLVPLIGSTTYTDQFTDAKLTLIMEMSGSLSEFKNRKEFVMYFPEERQKEIKRFIKRNQFQVRNGSPSEITQTMNAVCTLLESGGIP